MSPQGKTPASSNDDEKALVEKAFEVDYSQHLKAKNQQTRIALGVVGAGVGGALAVAASPVLLPGVAVASVVGATGGYQLAKRRGKNELKKNRLGADADQPVEDAAAGMPSVGRLKFLVRWGHLQLLQYEDAAVEWRCAVLDEVVCAFSPWVQKMYLLRAKGQPLEDEPEAYEAFRHLVHLYYFLQRKSAMEAVEKAVQALADAFDLGEADAASAQRCFVSFPSILETISVMDRLGHATHERLAVEMSASKIRGIGSPDRAHKQKRLRRIVSLICEVLRRPDVQEACSDRRSFEQRIALQEASSCQGTREQGLGPDSSQERQPVFSSEDGSRSPVARACSSSSRARARSVQLRLPPQGAEDEDHAQTDEEVEYYSCSEDEADGAQDSKGSPARRPARLAAPSPTARFQDAGARVASFRHRMAALPRGDQPHTWTEFGASNFDVRSGTYLKDRRKAPSGPAMTELVNVDFMLVGEDGPVWRACEHPDLFPAKHWASDDKRLLVVLNWVFPPYQCVITGALDPTAPWMTDCDSPQARIWHKFLQADEPGRRDIFKMIGSVEEGPWLVKRALPKKPVLIGKKVRMETYHEPGRHLEIVFDVSSGRAEQYATGIVCGSLKRLQLAFSALIEAREEAELPESLLISATCLNLDPSRLLSPLPAIT